MEDEGIMALPQGQAAQTDAPPALSSADTYDAALTGLRNNDPQQSSAVKAAVREAVAELNLSPDELDAVLQVLEYMSQHPEEYGRLRQSLIDRELMDPDDLPEQYDAEFLGAAIMVLNEAQLARAENAQAVTEMAPEVEGLGPLPMAEGGLADMARLLASKGRNGDTMLAHITPAEARLLKNRGGAGTFNPYTGLPEFFLKKLFKGIKKAVKSLLKNPIVRVVATVALAYFIGPTAAKVVGALAPAASAATTAAASAALTNVATSAAVSAMAGEKISGKNLLINAATSYFGAGGKIGTFNPVESVSAAAGKYLPGVTPGSAVAKGIGAGLTSAGIGALAGMDAQEALAMGLQTGVMTGFQQAQTVRNLNKMSDTDLSKLGYSAEAIAQIRSGVMPASAGAPAPAGAPEQAAAPAPAALPTEGELFAQGYMPDEIARMQTAATTAPAATQVAGTGGAPVVGTAAQTIPGKTFTERLGQFASKPGFDTFKDAFLVNPNETQNYLARYAPAALTTMGIGALTGGFKSEPVNESPLFNRNYTGSDFIRDNPQLFAGTLGRLEGMPPAYNPVVPYSTYSQMQTAARPTTPTPVVPRTTPPAGVVPPANIAGRMSAEELAAYYGLPELASPVPQPVYMAEGGPVNDSTSADYWFDVFMRNNPGRDPAYLRDIAEERAAIFRNQQASRAPAPAPAPTPAPAPAAKTTPADDPTSSDYWYGILLKNNPGIDPGRARQVATDRAAQFRAAQPVQDILTNIGGSPTTYVPSALPSAAALAASRFGSTPAAFSSAIDPRQFDAFNRLANRFGQQIEQPYQPTLYSMPRVEVPQMFQGMTQYGNLSPFENAGYSIPQVSAPRFFEKGGQATHFPRKTGPINGPGTGTSDSIPAMLSDGEFVFTAKAVRNAGGGSRRKGAKRMYALMKKLEGGPVKGNA